MTTITLRKATAGWASFGISGLALWAVALSVTVATRDAILLPTVLLTGSFLVPLTCLKAIEHYHPIDLPRTALVHTFVYGGIAGLLSAALVETWLPSRGQMSAFGVGLIEEAAKLAALWWISRRLPQHSMIHGLVLGASVGLGFSAFESAGYALNAVHAAGGMSLSSLVSMQVTRGLTEPVSHGLWTAIAGSVLFRESRGGRPRLTRPVVGAYVLVSCLHALWDLAPSLAKTVIGVPRSATHFSASITPLYWGVDDAILLAVAAIGLLTVHSYRARALTTCSRPDVDISQHPVAC